MVALNGFLTPGIKFFFKWYYMKLYNIVNYLIEFVDAMIEKMTTKTPNMYTEIKD